MNINPISFKSLMVFTLNDGKPKAPMPVLIQTAFRNNPKLKAYKLTDTATFNEDIDGTVHNAAMNFAKRLDELYRNILTKGSKKVKLTKVNFYVNPRETEERYFLTAATEEDEKRIHKLISRTDKFYSAKFGQKQ